MKALPALILFLAIVCAGGALPVAAAENASAAQTSSSAPAASTGALTSAEQNRRRDALRAEAAAATADVARQDWASALEAWQDLASKGVDAAPGQLCRLYFDARQGSFDAGTVADWCRRAAGTGDAGGLYRMGLLYLTGVGVAKDDAQAYAFCAAAQNRDVHVPAAFCLASVAAAQARDAHATLADVAPRRPADPTAGSTATRQAAATAGALCERAFVAAGIAFDAGSVVTWCSAAAQAGDMHAFERLGLIELLGLSGPRDVTAADSDCTIADTRSAGHAPAAFCLAAVAAARRVTRAGPGGPASDPVTGRPLPATLPDPFQTDRVLDQPRRTAGGLTYTCRRMADWSRFDAPGLVILRPGDTLFGKPVLSLGRRDFDELVRGAQACGDAVAAAPDDRLAGDLAHFATAMAALRTRQASLGRERHDARAEAAQLSGDQRDIAREMQSQMGGVRVDGNFATPQERACVDQVRRDLGGSLIGEARVLDIRHATRAESNGNFVVRGEARLVSAGGDIRIAREFAPFSCTFVGHTEKIANAAMSEPPSGAGAAAASP